MADVGGASVLNMGRQLVRWGGGGVNIVDVLGKGEQMCWLYWVKVGRHS